MKRSHDVESVVRRILRVNHAGEHGALEIYGAQLRALGAPKSEISRWLAETRVHEIEHRKRFFDAMGPRGAKPCRAMFIWRFGGFALGSATAIFGERAVFACTVAVETAVHRHLIDQISFLEQVDPELGQINRSILVEEDAHLSFAQSRLSRSNIAIYAFKAIVRAITELLILISTRGDSLNLAEAQQAR